MELLFKYGVETFKTFTFKDLCTPSVKGIDQTAHDIDSIPPEGDTTLKSGFIAPHHDVVVSGLPRNSVFKHGMDAGFVVDKGDAFIFVLAFTVKELFKHAPGSCFVPAQ